MATMEKEPYHHENLRQELIDAGIRIVAEEGVAALSLRRLAAECGVSHAAPYKHFKNKDEILAVLTIHVASLFTQRLQTVVDSIPAEQPYERLVMLGVSYVRFMVENPDYLKFLFFNGISDEVTAERLERLDCRPRDSLGIFRETAVAYLDSIHAAPQNHETSIMAMWAMVHGLSVMLVNRNWVPPGPYQDAVEHILRENLTFS